MIVEWLESGWASEYKKICFDCLTSNLHLFLGYAFVAFAAWVALSYDSGLHEQEIPQSKLPRPPSEFSSSDLKIMLSIFRKSIVSRLMDAIKVLQHTTLVWIVKFILKVFESAYGIRGNRWDYLRAFKTALVFYFVLIPLPAAFMPPVGVTQIAPNAELMIAVVLLVVINAVGDSISINFSVRVYRTAIVNQGHKSDLPGIDQHFLLFLKTAETDFGREIQFYLTLFLDFLFALMCLVVVLMASSVLYGIQVGEFSFSTDPANLSLMWDAALNFKRLAGTFYWFANDPGGFGGQPGIPGMFVFSITTFLPTFALALSALIWLFVLPLRILLATRIRNHTRLVISQAFIYVVCVLTTLAASIDAKAAYVFFTTT